MVFSSGRRKKIHTAFPFHPVTEAKHTANSSSLKTQGNAGLGRVTRELKLLLRTVQSIGVTISHTLDMLCKDELSLKLIQHRRYPQLPVPQSSRSTTVCALQCERLTTEPMQRDHNCKHCPTRLPCKEDRPVRCRQTMSKANYSM